MVFWWPKYPINTQYISEMIDGLFMSCMLLYALLSNAVLRIIFEAGILGVLCRLASRGAKMNPPMHRSSPVYLLCNDTL